MQQPNGKTAVLAAGGTGGHIFPAQALAHELKQKGWDVHLITDTAKSDFLTGFDVQNIHQVRAGAPFVRSPLKMIKAIWLMARGLIEAIALLRKIKPDVLVGFGGFPTVPPSIAAKMLGIPLMLHEANSVPGRANRLLSNFAKGIARSLPGAPFNKKSQDRETGNPVRQSVLKAKSRYSPVASDSKFNLLVFGGSQGAKFFSDILPISLGLLEPEIQERIKLTMQVREEELVSCQEKLEKSKCQVELAPFFNDMPAKIVDAHLVISRAGASTLSELTVLGRPSILVPYPYALDHDQANNAHALQQANGCLVIDQKMLTAELLAGNITTFFNNPDELEAMAAAAAKLGQPTAALNLANFVEEIVRS